jgi:hypothetical protein
MCTVTSDVCIRHVMCSVHIGVKVYQVHTSVYQVHTTGRNIMHARMQSGNKKEAIREHFGADVYSSSVHIGVPMWYSSFCSALKENRRNKHLVTKQTCGSIALK